MSDLISRQAAIEALQKEINKGKPPFDDVIGSIRCGVRLARNIIEDLPSVQPGPLSDAYTKAVWTWLLEYQIKAAELKGRYTPYEVLSWVANDWRKEHERSD